MLANSWVSASSQKLLVIKYHACKWQNFVTINSKIENSSVALSLENNSQVTCRLSNMPFGRPSVTASQRIWIAVCFLELQYLLISWMHLREIYTQTDGECQHSGHCCKLTQKIPLSPPCDVAWSYPVPCNITHINAEKKMVCTLVIVSSGHRCSETESVIVLICSGRNWTEPDTGYSHSLDCSSVTYRGRNAKMKLMNKTHTHWLW